MSRPSTHQAQFRGIESQHDSCLYISLDHCQSIFKISGAINQWSASFRLLYWVFAHVQLLVSIQNGAKWQQLNVPTGFYRVGTQRHRCWVWFRCLWPHPSLMAVWSEVKHTWNFKPVMHQKGQFLYQHWNMGIISELVARHLFASDIFSPTVTKNTRRQFLPAATP